MNLDFPVSESIIIYCGLSIVLLGIIMLIMIIYAALHRSFGKKKDEDEKPAPGCITQMIRVLLIFTLIFLGVGVIFFGAFIQSLTAFTKTELVAEVTCEEINSSDYEMRLILTEKSGRLANIPQEFLLNGDQWFIRGDVIKWDDWLNLLGVHTMYKLTRVGGYFTDPREERSGRSTHYSLIPEEETATWRWLFKNGHRMPFINNVYGNSDYQYPAADKVYKVYATTSGLSIRTEE